MDYKARFYDDCVYEDELKPRSVKMYVRRLGYAERLTGKPIHEINDPDLNAIKRGGIDGTIGLGRESVKGIMVAVRQFHYWGARKGHWKLNGISLVRTIKVPRNLPNPLSIEEIQALKAACRRPLEFRTIHGVIYTGLRVGEIAPIEGSWWQGDWIRLHREKNDSPREIPVHPELEKVKWKVLAWPPTYDSTLQKVKQRLSRQTGIKFTIHQLRDTFASFLHDAGVSQLCWRDLMGHSLGLDGVYALPSRREKRDAIYGLPF